MNRIEKSSVSNFRITSTVMYRSRLVKNAYRVFEVEMHLGKNKDQRRKEISSHLNK